MSKIPTDKEELKQYLERQNNGNALFKKTSLTTEDVILLLELFKENEQLKQELEKIEDKPINESWSKQYIYNNYNEVYEENKQLKQQLGKKTETFLKENVKINKITKEEIANYDDVDYCLITMEQFNELKGIVKDYKKLKKIYL